MQLKSFLRVSSATMLSRVLGFLRDTLVAAHLGTGSIADAFFIAFKLPNMFRSIFAEGAFNASFVPLFSKTLRNDPKNVTLFLSSVFSCLATVCLIMVLVGEFFMPSLLSLLAPGFQADPEKSRLAIILARLSFPYLAFISLASFFAATLVTLGSFFISSLVPVFLNIFMIGGLLLLHGSPPRAASFGLALSVIAAGVFQSFFLFVVCARKGMIPRLVLPRWRPDVAKLCFLALPGVLSACVTQINALVSTVIVSSQNGGVSWLYYADRVCQLPLALVGVAIGVVLLPELSKRIQAGDTKGSWRAQKRAWIFSFMLSLPATAGLILFSTDIVQILFKHGIFTDNDVRATSLALAIYSCGLPAFILIKVLSPSFFAREDTWTPLFISGSSIVLNLLLSVLLFPRLHYLAACVGLVISSWMNVFLLYGALHRSKLARFDAELLGKHGLVAVCVAVMTGLLLLGQTTLPHPQAVLGEAFRLLGMIVSGCVCYGLCLFAASYFFLSDSSPTEESAGGEIL